MSPARIDLTASEMREALDALYAIGEASLSRDEFARRGVDCLPRLARSELTTLSICDLDSGRRSVVSDRKDVISRRDLEVFDRHFFAHPLVCTHGRNPRATTKRIGDLLSESEFRRRPLYGDYYRRIGIDRVMAVPVHVDSHVLVSFVFNRSGREFSDREWARLELIRPHLGSLYRLSVAAHAVDQSAVEQPVQPLAVGLPLTPREQEVLGWLAAGKTDRDIGAILEISPRTVQKHLQRVYEKLGVETRTAAVMRALAVRQ